VFVQHDRDVNAASNILNVGRERPPLVAEISGLPIEWVLLGFWRKGLPPLHSPRKTPGFDGGP
jgi:transposase